MGPVLYLLYTCDIPQPVEVAIAAFTDDTAIMAVGEIMIETTIKLQNSIDSVSERAEKWHIKLNENKSTHVNFTNKTKDNYLPTVTNSNLVHMQI